MAGNKVTLDFAGDTAKLSKSFDDVGSGSERMADKVADANGRMDGFAESSDRAATKSATTYGAIGALGSGMALLGQDNSALAGALGATGLAFDALSGVTDLATLAMESNVIKTIASKVATTTASVATKAYAGAQWLLNAAMEANPIGLVIAAIVALIVIVAVIINHVHFFETVWDKAWGGAKRVAVDVWDWLKGLPGRLGSSFAALGGIILAPFKWAFNQVSDAWNNTAGKLSFHIPSWVPGIGGDGFSMPKLPHFHTGGVVPGAPGTEVLSVLLAGERVSPGAGGGSGATVTVRGGDAVTTAVLQAIRDEISGRFGGDVDFAIAGVR